MFNYQTNKRNSVANINILFRNAVKSTLFLKDLSDLQSDSYFL